MKLKVFTKHKRKQTLACYNMQNMQKSSPLQSSSHLKTQMCSSCPFHLPMSLLVSCTLKAAPKPERNLLMCRRFLLLFVTCAVRFLDCIRSQADTVSTFGGKGRISAFKLMQKNRKYQDAFTQLEKKWSVPRDLFSVLQEFTCELYATRCPSATVNELRYQLFQPKKGEVGSGQLPPYEDCLFMHSLRANYQAGVWRRALEECPSIPNPSGHGRCYEDGKLTICWRTGSPAPDVITEFLSCMCTSVCKLPNCQCLVNGLKCTVTCKLQDCNYWQENNSTVQNRDSEDSSDDKD